MNFSMKHFCIFCVVVIGLIGSSSIAQENATASKEQTAKQSTDPKPQQYVLKARASEIDKRAKQYPEIDFVFEKDGKPQDTQAASVDTRVAPKGRLVIWLMGHEQRLFDRVNSYGLHAIQVHYARNWFGKLCQPEPKSPQARGNIRLEAAVGEDFSDELSIEKPDSMVERARQFLIWLTMENPQGNWQQFLNSDQSEILWEKVTIAGSSHGSTTAARFAKHQRVGRVVMLCGPRDQDQDWQSLPSATPADRYYGFSHVLDTGWSGDHYPRSWKMLGLEKFCPIVDVDNATAPYSNSRQLTSAANVRGDVKAAHSSVTPNNVSPKDAEGKYLFEPVWKYLFE
jgi:hypothetical protein